MKNDNYSDILERMRRETIVLFPSMMKKEKDFSLCFNTVTGCFSSIVYNINNLVNKQYSISSDYCINELVNFFSYNQFLNINFLSKEDGIKFLLYTGRNEAVCWDLNLNLKYDHSPMIMERYKMLIIECPIKNFSKIFENYIYKEIEKLNIKYQKSLENTSLEINSLKPLISKLKNNKLPSEMFFEFDKHYSLNDIYIKISESSEIIKLTYDIDLKEEIKTLKDFIEIESNKVIKSKSKL